MTKPVILTGLRANNDLHIGNYFGALLPLIDMAKTRADEFQVNLFVPDLHSFTTPIDHTQLQAQIWKNLRIFAATGLPLDNPDIHVYRQSYIPAHSELTWILDNFTGFGQMRRMTQFKDKSGLNKRESELSDVMQVGLSADTQSQHMDDFVDDDEQIVTKASVGLFNYPVLMAADILLYGAEYVPVGDDQSQHLEFTRDIAERLNARFGDIFTLPKPVKEQHEFFGKDQGLRIKDLADPTKKMSKSDETGRGIIFLGDDPDEAAKKVMSATTDSEGNIRFDLEKQPGVSNLMQIQSLLLGQPLEETIRHWEGKSSYGDLKREVAELVKTFLIDFQSKLAEVNDDQLVAKLALDEQAMNEVANATLYRAQQAVGLRP
ncbi:tryptophan--tRNA ligase [Aeromicrobium sp.]|nr:tryptophan--tRNA ligase [Candidatus Saccharibacteria bacterium]